MSNQQDDSRLGRLKPDRRALAAAGLAGLLAFWWRRRQGQRGGSERPNEQEFATFVSFEPGTRRATVESTPGPLPPRLPECCIRVLGRPDWYDRELLHSVKLKPANAFVKAISSPLVAGTEITATTVGDTIYFRKPEGFDPHSPAGLSLLAHEIRHIEQYREHGGVIGFALHYVREYLQGGYGTDISFEAEAYEIGSTVYAHLQKEFTYNDDEDVCITLPNGGHTPNLLYAYLEPYPDLPRQV